MYGMGNRGTITPRNEPLVRGLLCSPCNKSLGGFHEDVGNLVNAIKYLSG
jgi:hypothetical protein